jgi:hypothetical protein
MNAARKFCNVIAERIVLIEYVLSEEGQTYPKYVIPRDDIPQEEIARAKVISAEVMSGDRRSRRVDENKKYMR